MTAKSTPPVICILTEFRGGGGDGATRAPHGLPCCVLEQDIFTHQKVLVILRKRWLRPYMTKKFLTGTLSIKPNQNRVSQSKAVVLMWSLLPVLESEFR